jgi:DNA-binding transcriptional MerR regulator
LFSVAEQLSFMPATIPNRPLFRSQEVCDLVQVQPYVLRSWEAEFPDLGMAKTAGGPRVYRRGDVERVLRISQLVFGDGLTLAGARKKLSEESGAPSEDAVTDADIAAMLDEQARQSLRDVKRGLQWVLGVLSGNGLTPEDRVLAASPATANGAPANGARSKSVAKKVTAKGAKRR